MVSLLPLLAVLVLVHSAGALLIGADGSMPPAAVTWHAGMPNNITVSPGTQVLFRWYGGKAASLGNTPKYVFWQLCADAPDDSLPLVTERNAGQFIFDTTGKDSTTAYFFSLSPSQCNQGFRVQVIIGGTTSSPVPNPTAMPTTTNAPSTTRAPTRKPTLFPTSFRPTHHPVPTTIAPTSYPSPYPTSYPVPAPTFKPTHSPVLATKTPTKTRRPTATPAPTSFPSTDSPSTGIIPQSGSSAPTAMPSTTLRPSTSMTPTMATRRPSHPSSTSPTALGTAINTGNSNPPTTTTFSPSLSGTVGVSSNSPTTSSAQINGTSTSSPTNSIRAGNATITTGTSSACLGACVGLSVGLTILFLTIAIVAVFLMAVKRRSSHAPSAVSMSTQGSPEVLRGSPGAKDSVKAPA